MTAVRRSESSCSGILMLGLVAWLVHGSFAYGQASAPSSKRTSPAPAARAGVASLEQFLHRALATHPEIVAAQSKVEAAQAELRRTRFQVARELITFWNEWKARERHVARLARLAPSDVVPEHELIEAKGKLAEMESQLPYLLGDVRGTGTGTPAAPGEAGAKRLPAGPEVEKITAALETPAPLEFIDTPLVDVSDTLQDYLQDDCGVKFVTDPTVQDVPVSIGMRDIPLGAALQALEDLTPRIRFVVRDYGIQATSDDSDAAATYISAAEFWRERQSQPKPSRSQKTAPSQRGRGKE